MLHMKMIFISLRIKGTAKDAYGITKFPICHIYSYQLSLSNHVTVKENDYKHDNSKVVFVWLMARIGFAFIFTFD